MAEDRINPEPQKKEDVDRVTESENANNERFESDTQKLVRQHLEDKDHVISDADIANIRVGMVPPDFDNASDSRFKDDNAAEAADNNLLNRADGGKEENLDDKRITPWDTIDPTS